MDYLVIALVSVVIIALLCGYIKATKKQSSQAHKKGTSATKTGVPSFSKCPLCDSLLDSKKGETIHSKVFRPMTVPDQRCNILGCPYCYPVVKPGVERRCPVCHKKVPLSGYLIARLFNKTEGNKHVHVIGCTECNRNGSKDI